MNSAFVYFHRFLGQGWRQKNPLFYKNIYNWKRKAAIHKSYLKCNFLDNIMHILLAKCEFDGLFHFFKNRELQTNKNKNKNKNKQTKNSLAARGSLRVGVSIRGPSRRTRMRVCGWRLWVCVFTWACLACVRE